MSRVALQLDNAAISRAETLRIADVVEDYFRERTVLSTNGHSFSLIISKSELSMITRWFSKGITVINYDGVFDHAVQAGVQSMVDLEGYRDPQMVAAIQHDTLHLRYCTLWSMKTTLNCHAKGRRAWVIKPSSFNQHS